MFITKNIASMVVNSNDTTIRSAPRSEKKNDGIAEKERAGFQSVGNGIKLNG